jgi:hypothetical protein
MAIFYEYKKGSYLKTRYNNHTQTLQINTSANKFFRNKMNLENGDEISNTIIHALIAFGDIHAIDLLPRLKSRVCARTMYQ